MTATQSVTLERTLDAPIDLVWRMWTDPEHFAAWYGPAGATMPVVEMDVTVGGTRHFCIEMQTPDGQSRMWFVGEYRVIEQPTRLVYTESMSDADGNSVSPEAMGMPSGHPELTEVTVELDDPRVGEGTIMGGRCARVAGEFLGLVDFKGSGLVAKLPKARVQELIDEGVGQPFAPAGKVFREWVSIPHCDRRRWRALLRESVAFVAPS